MQIVALVVIVVGFALILAGVVQLARARRGVQELPREIRALRARYGLDRPRWAEVRRSVHRGVAAPDPLRPAGSAYAAALLAAPGAGTGSGWQAMVLVGAVLQSAGGLANQLDSGHRTAAGLTAAGLVLLVAALVLQLVLRHRRPARAAAALAANR